MEATQARDLILGSRGTLKENTARWFVKSARNVLQGLNKGSEQKLGEFGFEVTYTAQTSKSKTKARNTPTTQNVNQTNHFCRRRISVISGGFLW